MNNPVDDLLSKLNTAPIDGQYTGEDYVFAQKHLPKDVTLAIPFCVREFIRDEDGNILMEEEVNLAGELIDEDGNAIPPDQIDKIKPAKSAAWRIRMDVLIVLAWVVARRKRPEITKETVALGIDNNNVAGVVNAVYAFWGVTGIQSEEDADEGKPGEDDGGTEPGNPDEPLEAKENWTIQKIGVAEENPAGAQDSVTEIVNSEEIPEAAQDHKLKKGPKTHKLLKAKEGT